MKYDDIISFYQKKWNRAETLFNSTERAMNIVLSKMFFQKFKNREDIPFSLLKDMGPAILNKKLKIKDGTIIITNKTQSPNGDWISYFSKWSSGAILSDHYHSDCEVLIQVKEGLVSVVKNLSENPIHQNIHSGESLIIERNTTYYIVSVIDSEISVTYTKSEKVHITPNTNSPYE